MGKELIISIIIIVAIFFGNYITQEYTKETVENISSQLTQLRKEIKQEQDNAKTDEQMKELYQQWQARNEKLSYYIEHDELDKVNTELTSLKANIETKEYEQAISHLDTSVFLLQHIEEKEKFKLKNIF